MKNAFLELEPVHYSEAAVKALQFVAEPQSEGFRLHWHDRVEILRITDGKIKIKYGTADKILSKNNLMLIPPGLLHSGAPFGGGVKYNVLMFDIRRFYNDTEICKKLLPPLFDGRAIFESVISNSEIISAFDVLFENAANGSLGTVAQIYRIIELFYEKCLVEFGANPKNQAVKKIVDYIEQNAADEITTASLTKKFGYTEAYLCRKFKHATGLSPMAYLKIYRLEAARKKIINTGGSVGDIAAEFGFSDANYFTRCFKAHFGVPPTKINPHKSQ